MKFSIIIPTYDHLEDCLKPCINSIIKYTDLTNKEVIIVANGCKADTAEYLGKNIPKGCKALWFNEPLGFTKASNEGMKLANGEYIVLLNNDVVLLDQNVDDWIKVLQEPFLKDNKTGITGPIKFWDEYGGRICTSIAFWCAMFPRKLVDEIGLLDEVFSPGMGEDTDFSVKAEMRGYKLTGVALDINHKFGDPIKPEECVFPIWHKGNGTFASIDAKDEIIQRNHKVLVERYRVPKATIPFTQDQIVHCQISEERKTFYPFEHNTNKEISIVIPTYNHCNDLLKPCCESIIQYTKFENLEILIVANGCIDETKEYVEKLGEPFKLVWSDEKLGYTKAANLGIKHSKGKYIVLMNNDVLCLPQEQNMWLDMLKEPFIKDPKTGIAGPLMLHDDYADADVLIFFCVMISRELFEKIGYLDETYAPGGGEDIDFTIRCRAAGYKAALSNTMSSQNVGILPLYHKGEGTFSNEEHPEYGKYIIKNNGTLNAKRFNQHIRLNLENVMLPGYLTVAKEDSHHILMDPCNLDFEDNRIEEILALKVLENQLEEIFKNWFRVLKSGGKLTLNNPEIINICQKVGFKVELKSDKKIEFRK